MADMKLDEIGFYTLSDQRAAHALELFRPLARCELLITGRCNFKCSYCRGVGGNDLSLEEALRTIIMWANDDLSAIRFSGGEPTLVANLNIMVTVARSLGITRIAVSSNGSLPWWRYDELISLGVNDFSISLDACCAADGIVMAGGTDAWHRVIDNIRRISAKVYTTVGIVVTEQNAPTINKTIELAASLGVHDIRVIPAAQVSNFLNEIEVNEELLLRFPILQYRVRNLRRGRAVRGIDSFDSHRCALVLDDMAAMGGQHYPCIIYMREGGSAIGKVSNSMRQERQEWYNKHNSKFDPICSRNCLDVCVAYNNRVRDLN